jgi:hypothetical protein
VDADISEERLFSVYLPILAQEISAIPVQPGLMNATVASNLYQSEKSAMVEQGKDVVHHILLNDTSILRTPDAGTISQGKQYRFSCIS